MTNIDWRKPVCGWCDFEATSREGQRAHALVCEKSPLVAERDALRQQLEEFSRESSLTLKFNNADPVFLWEGSGSKKLSEFDLFTRTEVDALKMRVASAVWQASLAYIDTCTANSNYGTPLDLADVVKGVT